MSEYSVSSFWKEFPDNESCLEYIFKKKYPYVTGYKIWGRKAYADKDGNHYSPLADTIFEKSSTPLTLWFYAIYLFSVSKNGVSAKELQRQLGVTYKTAWRMAKRIRSLMENKEVLRGVVEADETLIGGRKRLAQGGKGKTGVLGLVERGGRIRATVAPRTRKLLLNNIVNKVAKRTVIYTDQYAGYVRLSRMRYTHDTVNHSRYEFARGDVHTNTIEGFWGHLKRSLRGTYNSVSPTYLQLYVDEFCFRYRKTSSEIFQEMMKRL